MNTDTSTQAIGFTHNLIGSIPGILKKGTADGVKLLWGAIIPDLIKHWQFWMGVYFTIFFVATFEHMLGRWGTLGSILYNTFYFGTLFILGLVLGPQIFINDVFKVACTVILYPVCYLLTGWLLDITRARMGFK